MAVPHECCRDDDISGMVVTICQHFANGTSLDSSSVARRNVIRGGKTRNSKIINYDQTIGRQSGHLA